MFLSKLMINLRHRPARRDLGDRYELHRTLMNAFPEQLPADERVLYRVEHASGQAGATVLVQSQTPPDWSSVERLNDMRYLRRLPQVKSFAPQVQAGLQLHFRLQANPTVKRYGKRYALYAEEEWMSWLERKGQAHGFAVEPLDVRCVKLGNHYGQRRRQTWHAVQFDGLLRVSQPPAFFSGITPWHRQRQGIRFWLAFRRPPFLIPAAPLNWSEEFSCRGAD